MDSIEQHIPGRYEETTLASQGRQWSCAVRNKTACMATSYRGNTSPRTGLGFIMCLCLKSIKQDERQPRVCERLPAPAAGSIDRGPIQVP